MVNRCRKVSGEYTTARGKAKIPDKYTYLWFLSRTPQIDEQIYLQLLARMAAQGFKTDRMIRTLHPSAEQQSE